MPDTKTNKQKKDIKKTGNKSLVSKFNLPSKEIEIISNIKISIRGNVPPGMMPFSWITKGKNINEAVIRTFTGMVTLKSIRYY